MYCQRASHLLGSLVLPSATCEPLGGLQPRCLSAAILDVNLYRWLPPHQRTQTQGSPDVDIFPIQRWNQYKTFEGLSRLPKRYGWLSPTPQGMHIIQSSSWSRSIYLKARYYLHTHRRTQLLATQMPEGGHLEFPKHYRWFPLRSEHRHNERIL